MKRILKSVDSSIIGIGLYLFLAAFGTVFFYLGLSSMGLSHHGLAMPTLTFEFGSILVASFGLMLLWGGIYHAHISTLFGRPEATISLELVKPGSQFNFELRRKVRHQTKIEYVGVYLVLRETISFHDVNDPATRIIDRLFQKYTQPGRKYNVHDSVYVSCQFQIPENYRQLANPYTNELNVKVQQMWVIKVRVHLEKNVTIQAGWNEK